MSADTKGLADRLEFAARLLDRKPSEVYGLAGTCREAASALRAYLSHSPGAVGVRKLEWTYMPSYGEVPFAQLREAVAEAQIGNRHFVDPALDPDRFLGHQIVPTINFNSLNRIVSAFVRSALAGPVGEVVAEDDFAWLVESFSGQTENYLKGFEELYAGTGFSWSPVWTAEHAEALRFSRETDARRIAAVMPKSSKSRSVEHGWLGTRHALAHPPSGEAMREALGVAGWNACRKSIYAVCEDVQNEAERLRTTSKPGTASEEQHAKGYYAGTCYAAKSIARGFNSMNALDDDNLRAALRTGGDRG